MSDSTNDSGVNSFKNKDQIWARCHRDHSNSGFFSFDFQEKSLFIDFFFPHFPMIFHFPPLVF